MQDQFAVGNVIGLYELKEQIDRSHSEVKFRARNIESGGPALIRIQQAVAEHRDATQRRFREIQVLRGLSHPNIAPILDAGHIYGRIYICTELPRGVSLEQQIREGNLDRGMDEFDSLLEALEFVHAKGVIHRGIAPKNLYVLPDGQLTLTGFGLACSASDPRLTAKGLIIGVPGYMSPEQAEGVEELDHRTDLYSAAAVLYEILTGHPPFAADSYFKLIVQHRSGAFWPPRSVRPDLENEWVEILVRGLSRDRDGRFQSAAEFRKALARVEVGSDRLLHVR